MSDKTSTLRETIADAVDTLESEYADMVGDRDYSDRLHEIADGAVPVYTSELLEIAANDNNVATDQPELGPAFDGTPTPVNIIAANVYEAIYNALCSRWQELEDEREEKENAELAATPTPAGRAE